MSGGSREALFASRPFPHWRCDFDGGSIRFLGRMPGPELPARGEALQRLDDAPPRLAWLDQIHSARVRHASDGACGKGDGFWTKRPGLALSIVTADCVPIVCGNQRVVAAIHAGWRGLVAGVVAATLARLPVEASHLQAWLGPAIGPCCYEVGHDVAERVVRASTPEATTDHPGARPHVDLQRAAELQLLELGVGSVSRIEVCTRCNPDLLWSYRGSSAAAGRNLSFAWLASPAGGSSGTG